MKINSSEANKLLKKLENEYSNLEEQESAASSFLCAITEKIEDVRPEYDYEKTQKELIEIESKVRYIKHKINEFNLKTIVKEFDMSVDQLLVYLPQLNKRKAKLQEMQNKIQKQRAQSYSQIIEYTYLNYDLKKVKKDYQEITEIITKVENALNEVNLKKVIEIEIEI